MRELDGERYLDLKEIEKQYGWKPGTVYYFRERNLLNLYSFVGDRRSYCKVVELDAIKNRPPELRKPGPKPDALATTKLHRARGRMVVGGHAPATTM